MRVHLVLGGEVVVAFGAPVWGGRRVVFLGHFGTDAGPWEQSSIPVDQDLLCDLLVAVVSSGRSTSLPFSNFAPARTSATRWGALTARQRDWAASISL